MEKDAILKFLKTQRPLGFKEIMSKLGLGRAEARSLKRTLGHMVRDGEVVLTKKGFYGSRSDMDLERGYFEAHRNGYGFVIMDKPGERDIFVPAHRKAGAMNNDRVLVSIEDRTRRDGRIVRILERAHQRVTGTIEAQSIGERRGLKGTAMYLKPKNRSIPQDIHIAREHLGGAKDGETAVVEIISYPTYNRPPSGKVVKVIEKPRSAKAETQAVIDEFGLPEGFPRRVLGEAREIVKAEDGRKDKRKDLSTLPTVTIDGETAKDFDDAVSIELTEQGFRLWVHIADVGYYVPWGSAIDLEARKRGTSVYFPDSVIPMLPKELSEDLASLMPHEPRRTLTAEMDFDRYGKRFGTKIYPSLIVSDERMTYTSVRKVLVDQDAKARKRYEKLLGVFELMSELAGVLRQRRLERGSLDFDLPEPEVLLDIKGNPEAIVRAERNLAHMMIEEFMLAANEAVAEYLTKLGTPMLYRVHEKPDPHKLSEILGTLRELLGRPVREIPEVLASVKGKPEEEVVVLLVLRTLKQARYSPLNVGHFGLASECYTHFTSPIRRYPDLVVHRILRELFGKKTKRLSKSRTEELEGLLPDIAFNSSRMERVAEEAERNVLDAMKVWFMKDRLGESFRATVVKASSFGLSVRLRDFYVEGVIPVSSLTDDYYVFSDSGLSLKGRRTKRTFSIGQQLEVRLDSINEDRRELHFGLPDAPAATKNRTFRPHRN